MTRVAGSGVLLSVVVLSGMGWTSVRGVDVQRHKPVWWLAREAGSRQPGTRDAAVAELVRRISLGKPGNITDEQLTPLLNRALAHQADTSQPWVPGWGLLIEAAHDADRLSEDRWDLYRVQGLALRLRVREVIRRGDPIPIEFWSDPPRLGTRPTGNAVTSPIVGLADLAPELTIGGQVISDARHGPGTLLLSWAANPRQLGSAIYEPPASVFTALADGPQTVQVSCLVTLWETPSGYSAFGRQRGPPPIRRVLRTVWKLVPSGTETVGTATDEPQPRRGRALDPGNGGGPGRLRHAHAQPSPAIPPCRWRARPISRQGGREWPLGLATFGTEQLPGAVRHRPVSRPRTRHGRAEPAARARRGRADDRHHQDLG